MAFKKIPLTIDTMIRNPVPVEGINQEDNVELNIVVTENKTPKDLSSQTIKVYVRRIDGTLVEQTDQITPTNASKGEVTVKLKNSAFNKEGYALFQLDVSDSDGRITSSYATFKIGKGLVSGEAIANTNEIEALKKVEEYIKKANQELETFKQTVAEINENEATRQENEVVRVNEEVSRNEAEAIRAQQEATRKEKENERVQAEIKRIADEEMRRENEVLRGSKELERKQAEELRKETELLRIEDENNRKVAESKRIEVESVRVEAEKLRVVAETGRVEAESLRVTAEEERVAAETKREEGFNKFDGKINANTEELKNARSATTGEKFNSLDERIDCEVDRLNKKIEVSFLQQEDKENHVIENTVEGMTTNMIIKGKTLYKKSDGSYTDILEENVTLESFGQQEKKISILSHGKNLFNYGNLTGGEIVTFNDRKCYKFTDNSTNFTLDVKGEENKQYTISIKMYREPSQIEKRLNVQFVYSDGTFKTYNLDHNVLREFTTESGKTLVKIKGAYNHSLNAYIDLECTQLEEGTIKTTYEPYKQDKKDILLQDLGFDEGLRGINDISDELNSLRNVTIKRIGKREYREGDELLENIITDKTNTYYVLEEPIETPLDENINLKTFGERTYISFENALNGTSSFKAPVNTLKTIARLSNENTRLKRDLALHAENTIATDEAITDYSLDMDYKLCLLEMELVEIKKKLGGK